MRRIEEAITDFICDKVRDDVEYFTNEIESSVNLHAGLIKKLQADLQLLIEAVECNGDRILELERPWYRRILNLGRKNARR